MKITKKILFLLIFFLFFLILNNKVFGFVLEENGQAKYYLKDYSSFEDKEKVFIYNSTTKEVQCYYSGFNSQMVFDSAAMCLRSISKIDFNTDDNLFYISCLVTENSDGTFTGSDWTSRASYVSSIYFEQSNLLKFKYIGGNAKIYPYSSKINKFFTTSDLPLGLKFTDDFLLLTSSKEEYDYILALPSTSFDKYRYFYKNRLVVSSQGWCLHYLQDRRKFSSKIYVYQNGGWIYLQSLTEFTETNLGVSFNDFIYCNAPVGNGETNTEIQKVCFFDSLTKYVHFPFIVNSAEDLSQGNSNILVEPAEFKPNENIVFSITYKDEETNETIDLIEPLILNSSSEYFVQISEDVFYYEIDYNLFQSLLQIGVQYNYKIAYSYDNNAYFKNVFSTYGGLSDDDIFKNQIENQNILLKEKFEHIINIIRETSNNHTMILKETEKTNKGILDTIKEVLSYINPLSENFFAYKLVDLLLQGLKNLFIPSDEFFSNFFNDLKNWFSERFGFLMYPFELLIEILNRILNINLSEPIIDIPEIVEPVTNTKLINSINFNFNDLLENNVLNTVHNIYLIILDAFIIFGLVNLAKSKFEEVITK